MASVLTVGEYPLSQHFAGRAGELAAVARWWREGSSPLLIVGEGGAGKSAILAQWVADLERAERKTGVAWYSFYAGGGSFRDFVDSVAHALDVAAEPDRRAAVVTALAARRAVVALDGVERCLAAYHRHDSARGQNAADGDRAFVEPWAAAFLHALAAARVPLVMTSREVPEGLEDHAEILDVEALDAADAAAFFPDVAPALAGALLEDAGAHALTARLLRGVLETSPSFRPPGATVEARRVAIFTEAWSLLSPRDRSALAALAAFRSAVSVRVAHALLRDDDQPAPTDEEARVRLSALEAAGWILFARGRVLDLHPIVRAFAFSQLKHEAADALVDRVRPHCLGDEGGAQTVHDLGPALDLFHMLCDRGRYQEASGVFDRLRTPLERLGGVEERVTMLARLLPKDLTGPALLTSPADASVRATDYEIALRAAGRERDARRVCAWVLEYDLQRGALADHVEADILNHALELMEDAEQRPLGLRCAEVAADLAEAAGLDVLTSQTSLASHLAQMGRVEQLEALAADLEPSLAERRQSGHPFDHCDVRYAFARITLAIGVELDAGPGLARLQAIVDAGHADAFDRQALASERGAVAAMAGDFVAARAHAERACTIAREAGGMREDDEALLAYAAAHGDRALAERLLATDTPASPKARLLRLLARVAMGDRRDATRDEALAAYRDAWGLGPGWHDVVMLRLARLALAKLDTPEPTLAAVASPELAEPAFLPRARALVEVYRRVPSSAAVAHAAAAFELQGEEEDFVVELGSDELLSEALEAMDPRTSGLCIDASWSSVPFGVLLSQVAASVGGRALTRLTVRGGSSGGATKAPIVLPPSLVQLTLGPSESFVLARRRPRLRLAPLPALRKLHVTASLVDPTDSTAWIDFATSPLEGPLDALSLTLPSWLRTEDLPALRALLVAAAPASLTLRGRGSRLPARPDVHALSYLLEPLRGLRALRLSLVHLDPDDVAPLIELATDRELLVEHHKLDAWSADRLRTSVPGAIVA